MGNDGRTTCPDCKGFGRCKKNCPRTFPPKGWEDKIKPGKDDK
jgi:hypothetical protein